MVTIFSGNAQGLRRKLARHTFFRFLKENKCDIAFVQESYVTDNLVSEWSKEWGCQIFANSGTAHSKGELILFSKAFFKELKNLTVCHKENRIIGVNFEFDNKKYICINGYAPNGAAEKIDFYKRLYQVIESVKDDDAQLILAADLNCTIEPRMDNLGGKNHSKAEVNELNNLVNKLGLIDSWRMFHSNEKSYTWKHKSNPILRRIDYVLVNEQCFNQISDIDIVTIPNSDHRGYLCFLESIKTKRGPSYWKLNNSFLKNNDYVEGVNKIIQNCITLEGDPQVLWDYCKTQIKTFSLAYGKRKAQENKTELCKVEIKLSKACKNLSQNPDNAQHLQDVNNFKNKYDILSMSKTQGDLIRSKADWAEKGEKSNKYFLQLEKTRAKQKLMTVLELDDGTIVTDPELIMSEQIKFYQNLYKDTKVYRKASLEDFIKDVNIPKLSEEESSTCEGEITYRECVLSLRTMRNEASPGLDGLSAAFYKMFWLKLGNLVVKSLNRGFHEGQLSCTQKEGLMTLLPKKDLPRKFLKNWRPLTLTNVDYKLAAKVLAMRLKSVVTSIVHEDQCGYIKKRTSATILRGIDDVMNYLDTEQQGGILLAVDFSKAYDSIFKDFMYDALETFGFGESFVKWIKTLNNNCMSYLSYNGCISGSIKLERGIKQGCPISPVLYVIATEILSCRIRQATNIKGVSLPNNKEIKMLQYADDTTMFLKDTASFNNALVLYDLFENVSGLKVNREKTDAIWLGKWKMKNEKIGNVRWKLYPNNKFKILGVTFCTTEPVILLDENVNDRFLKCEKIMKMWSMRSLTVFGKVTLIKSLLSSQFLYIMQSFILPEEILNRMNTMFFKFIWAKGRYKEDELKKVPEKVKRNILIQEYKDGGIKMIDMKDMQTSFALKWIKLILEPGNGHWRCLPTYYYNHFACNLTVFNCNSNLCNLQGIPKFYQSVLKSWQQIKTTPDETIIWNNDLLKISGKTICFKNWIFKDVNYFKDIVDNDNCLLSYDILSRKIGRNPTTFIQYLGLKSVIVQHFLQEKCNVEKLKDVYFNGKIITKCNTKDFRHFIVRKKMEKVKYSDLEVTNAMWMEAYKCTLNTKLWNIHWKTLHNIFPCNSTLKRFRIKELNICETCNVKDDNLHYFVKCRNVKKIWDNFHGITDEQILGLSKCKDYCKVLTARRTIQMFNINKIGNINTLFHALM